MTSSGHYSSISNLRIRYRRNYTMTRQGSPFIQLRRNGNYQEVPMLRGKYTGF